MARNPLSEGKYVTVLQTVNTTGANPAATTVSAVRQVRRVVKVEHFAGAGADPSRVVAPSSGTDMLGNIVYLYSTDLAGTPATVNDRFWLTIETG